MRTVWPVLGAWLLLAMTTAGYTVLVCVLAWYFGLPWWIGVVPGVVSIVVAEIIIGVSSDPPVKAKLTDAAEEDEPRLHAVVDRLCALSGQEKPILRIMETEAPNSLVYVAKGERRPTLCVSRGLLEQLNNPLLESVLAHEFAHIAHRDARVMVFAEAMAGGVAWLPVSLVPVVEKLDPLLCEAARWCGRPWTPVFEKESEDGQSAPAPERRAPLLIAALLLVLLGTARTVLITLMCVVVLSLGIPAAIVCLPGYVALYRLSRRRELAADRGAAELTGAPARLASALRELEGGMLAVPKKDLRELAHGVPLAILPFQKPDKDEEALLRFIDWIFRSHPRTARRVALLEGDARDMATRARG